jgi:hypothetical protein
LAYGKYNDVKELIMALVMFCEAGNEYNEKEYKNCIKLLDKIKNA